MLLFWHILVFASVLHRMMLIGHTHFSQLMEWKNLGVTTLKHDTCAPTVFKILPENQITTDFTYLTSPKVCNSISHKEKKSVPEKFYGNSGIMIFGEINQVLSSY